LTRLLSGFAEHFFVAGSVKKPSGVALVNLHGHRHPRHKVLLVVVARGVFFFFGVDVAEREEAGRRAV
jgi:hypothetical protein